jgi:hypothetical protein
MCGSADRAGDSRVFIGRARSSRFAMEVKPVRSASIYIEHRTLKRLKLLRHLYPETSYLPSGDAMDKTADERADEIINQMIEEKYPGVIALEGELAKTEKAFMEKWSQ